MFCSMCGKELKDGVKFCKYCGASQQSDFEVSDGNFENEKFSEIEQVSKKTSTYGVFLVLGVVAVIITFVIAGAVIGVIKSRRECDRCGKTFVGAAYYDAFDYEEIMCEDCAKEYYAPFPYTGYKVR